MGPTEWLAVSFLSKLSNGNTTLTVTLPHGQATSFLKKGELLAQDMPSNMSQRVTDGQVLSLSRPASGEFDAHYYLINIAATAATASTAPPASATSQPPTRAQQQQQYQQQHPGFIDLPRNSGSGSAFEDGPPHPGAPPGWLYESHIAEQVLEDMLAEANVTVVRELVGLASAVKAGTMLKSVTSEAGTTLSGDIWIDGSYEGDLGYVGGADFTWGRESESEYNENGAGSQIGTGTELHYAVNPYWNNASGEVIPHVSPILPNPLGTADKRIEVYDFRLCITNSPGNRLPFYEPKGYNASEWEFWRRLWQYGKTPPANLQSAGLGCIGPIPNNYSDCGDGVACIKCDMLGMEHSTDMLNGAWGYPNGTTEERKAIRQAHINYTLGLLWFYATDPAAGDQLHEEMAGLGFCTDEYLNGADGDPPHWPYQLYVREARRMLGDFVWTEHDPPAAIADRTVGLGAYTFDCHWVSLYADGATTKAEGRVNNGHDGKRSGGVGQAPFGIPYDALLPKRAQLTNVLVPVAASMSHLRQNAVRMEPTWMIMAHAAGSAAALAITHGVAVQDVNVEELQTLLVTKQRQMIRPCCPPLQP